jgi:antitoxin ParD1/3/4
MSAEVPCAVALGSRLSGRGGTGAILTITAAGGMLSAEDVSMDTVNISLPENLKEFVVTQVSEGGYGSVSQYVSALIQADQQQKAKAVIETEVLKGVQSGPSAPMIAEDWQRIRDEVRERFDARERA